MNAIILAAGMGTRLRPLTNDRPKCMVEVNGTPMVEQQIKFLKEVGIEYITLVSGYKAESLDFLKEKYGVDIVFNDKYEVCNNIYSMYLVRELLSDTFVLEGDVYMDKNCLKVPEHSTYFSKWVDGYKREWGLSVDAQNRLTDIVPGDGCGYIMSGISFWKAEDAKKIVDRMEKIIENEDYTDLFLDNVVLDIHKDLDVYVQRVEGIYEIDTETELREVEQAVK